jgi:hypothetical protein
VRKPQEWKSTGIADAKDVVTYTLTDVLSEVIFNLFLACQT